VLTNNHVIDGATTIRVRIPGTGRTYSATVVGYAVGADIAVLRLKNASGLTTVATGDATKVRLGQAVRAVGNAGGTGTLTIAPGRIIGLGKTITAGDEQGNSEQLTGLLETDAGVQPGDSGGPLIDSSGHVVGMTTAASSTGNGFFFQNAPNDAYAIPINRALELTKQIEQGRTTAALHIGPTALLGVSVGSSDPYGYGDGAGYPGASATGAVVGGVVPGSPADRAGLTDGVTILSIDGRRVASPNALRALMLQHHPGDRITLRWSDGFGNESVSTTTLASGPPQ
jgi:S1-C subfamily serine protease